MAWSDVAAEFLKFINRITLRPSREIKKVIRIYDEMHRVLEDSDVQRFLIFKAHNGGGLIRPSTPLYVSALYEDYTFPFKSVKNEYQKLQVDPEYLRLLSELCEKRTVKLYTNKLKNSLLKDIYVAEGVQVSEIYFLGQDRKNLYFCSIASAEHDFLETPEEKLCVKLAINTIKNNII